MKKATRSLFTLSLVGALSIAAVKYAYDESGRVDLGESTQEEKPLFVFKPNDVSEIVIDHLGEKTHIQYENQRGILKRPIMLAVSQSELSRWVNEIAHLIPEQRFDADSAQIPGPAATGLESPRCTIKVSLKTTDGKMESSDLYVSLGSKNEFNAQYYIGFSRGSQDTQLALISSTLNSRLAKTWHDFIERRMTGVDPTEIHSLEVVPREQTETQIAFKLQRNLSVDQGAQSEAHSFRIVSPFQDDANEKNATEIIQSLYRTPIKEFTIAKPDGGHLSNGADSPEFRVTIEGKYSRNQKPFKKTLLLSASEKDGTMVVASKGENWISMMPAHIFKPLQQSARSLRTLKVINIDRRIVTRLEIDVPKEPTLILEREAGTDWDNPRWNLLAPKPGVAKAYLVTSLILAFGNLDGLQRVADGPAVDKPETLQQLGLDAPIRMRFYGAQEKLMTELLLGETQSRQLYAKIKGEKRIFEVPYSRLNAIPKDASSLMR